MSKRKLSSTRQPYEPTDDASVKDDMVHVTSDMLSGSPDIFAGKKGDRATEPEPERYKRRVEKPRATIKLHAGGEQEAQPKD